MPDLGKRDVVGLGQIEALDAGVRHEALVQVDQLFPNGSQKVAKFRQRRVLAIEVRHGDDELIALGDHNVTSHSTAQSGST